MTGDLKQGIRALSPVQDQGQLEKKVLGHLRKVQALPQRGINYFSHLCIQYAASGI